jgi:hypothetical protein
MQSFENRVQKMSTNTNVDASRVLRRAEAFAATLDARSLTEAAEERLRSVRIHRVAGGGVLGCVCVSVFFKFLSFNKNSKTKRACSIWRL